MWPSDIMKRRSTLRTLFVAVCGLGVGVATAVVPSTASAQAGFSYKVESGVQKGESKPAVILRATGDIAEATIELEREDGKTITKEIGSMSADETTRIPIDQPTGTYAYDITIRGKGADGAEIDTSFQARMKVLGELEVRVQKDRAQVASGQVTMEGNRPIEKVHVTVRNDTGKTVHEEMVRVGGKTGRFTVEWPEVEDVASVELKAYDVHGFWRGMKLEPFWVEIPHDEVRFKFGTAKWEDDQIPKLEDSLERIREAMQKHGDKGLKLQLYISGYTDTVGSKSSNRELSRKRARAIGEWFRNNGLDIPVYYQGFGEDVLAVQTPDDTKKKENRRAIYILGNARPPTSEEIPRSNWKRLK